MKPNALNDPDPIEELLLMAYPNPERKGCPGYNMLEALGNLRVADDHPTWEHIWHCSPCFSQFKAIRDRRWAKEQRDSQRKKRMTSVAALAALAIIGCVLYVFMRAARPAHAPEVAAITLNLYDAEVVRGINENKQVELPPIPPEIDELRIVLPRFSEPGHYTVAVLRSRDNASAVAIASGTAIGNQMKSELTVRLDLSNVSPGEYFLGTRNGADQAVRYYPLKIAQHQ